MYWRAGWWPSYVTVVSRQDHGGYTAASSEMLEKGKAQTREQLLAMIRMLLGGRAAEVVFYCPDEGISTGASRDLEKAGGLARAMICEYGMDETGEILSAPALLRSESALASPVYQKVDAVAQQILRRELERTQELLATHRRHLDALVAALLEKERLTAEELRAILPENRES
jgi:ATP-dependent Zn protease